MRTAEGFADGLAEDLVWRKKELTVLRRLVATATGDRRDVLVRSLVTVLYAHWEGFLRNTAESYLEHVAARRLRYSELSRNFVAYALLPRVRAAAEQRNLGDMIEVVRFFQEEMERRSRFSADAVDAGSNLSSRVLRELTTMLGLDYRVFESKAVLIDERLLRNRNRIAHGHYLSLDAEDALELAREVLSLMEVFRDEVENAVVLSRYKQGVSWVGG